VLEDEDELDAPVLAPVVEREHHGHPQRDDQHGGEEGERRQAQEPRQGLAQADHAPSPASGRKVISSARHASATLSPSAGIVSPVFWRMTKTSPALVMTQ